MSNLQMFSEQERTKLMQEAEKFKEEHDMKGFWVPEKGENSFSVLDKEIREMDFGNGLRKIFRVKVNNEEKDWSVNPRNPVYRQLIDRLANGERDFVLQRSGEQKTTRYEFLDKKSNGTLEESKEQEKESGKGDVKAKEEPLAQ